MLFPRDVADQFLDFVYSLLVGTTVAIVAAAESIRLVEAVAPVVLVVEKPD